MGLTKTLCLHSQSKLHSLHSSKNNNLSINSPLTHEPPKVLPFHLTKIKVPLKLSSPSISPLPTSNFSIKNKTFTKFLAERVLVSLIGVFIFMGSFSFIVRPSLAFPGQAGDSGENMEEKRETQMGKSGEDEKMYEELLEKEPRNVKALKVIVYRKMRKGQTKEAVKYVERLMDIEPDEVEWRLLEALCYEMMGQLNKARSLFKEILEERPLLLRALHGLAMVMHKNLEGPAVFEMLNKALEVARREKRVIEERNIRILIAQMHVVKGQLEEGLKKFQNLVDENPRDFRPYLCQGIIYSLLDRQKEAAEQFETYRCLVPEEFPQKGFLDDVVLAAKTKPTEHLQKEFEAEFSYRK